MFTIALTGGIASGKTTVSNIFKSMNIPIIDTDIIAREIVEPSKPAYQEIIALFGSAILNEEKSINRKALSQIIFSSKKKRLQLESLLHPLIWIEVQNKLNALYAPYCIIVVPLLIENFEKITAVKFDRVLVIDSEEDRQVSRSQERDNIDIELIGKIMQSQVSRKIRLESADDVILNSENIAALNEKVEQLHKKYLTLSY